MCHSVQDGSGAIRSRGIQAAGREVFEMKAMTYAAYGPPESLQLREIDRSFPLAELPLALRNLETGHARGKVVIVMDDDTHR